MTAFTHSLAIVIGIDAYGRGVPPLTTAVIDATRLAELLRPAPGRGRTRTVAVPDTITGGALMKSFLKRF